MKLNEIQDLIKFVAKSGVSEVELETKDVKIVIKTPAGKKDQVFVQTSTPVVQSSQVVQQVANPATFTSGVFVSATGFATLDPCQRRLRAGGLTRQDGLRSRTRA